MIQHVRVDHNTHDAISAAARDAGIAYDVMLTQIVHDWAINWRNKQRQHTIHLQDNAGVIPGGD